MMLLKICGFVDWNWCLVCLPIIVVGTVNIVYGVLKIVVKIKELKNAKNKHE